MYYIHAIGAALAPTEISSAMLRQLRQGEVPEPELVQARHSILQRDYLLETRNCDQAEARANSVLTVAELSATACRLAVAAAGRELSDCDLLIADTLTPWQITPSEAQRIAFSLGLKITSFDIGSGGVSFPMLLQIVQNWGELAKEQQLLLCSVHAPTLYVDYRCSKEAGLFSDAAVSMLLGKERSGFEVLALQLDNSGSVNSGISFSPFHSCSVNPDFFNSAARNCIVASWPAISKVLSSDSKVTVCINDYGADTFELLREIGCKNSISVLNTFSKSGDSLGCVSAVGMWEWSRTAQSGEVFIGFSPGCGQQSGAFVVRKI